MLVVDKHLPNRFSPLYPLNIYLGLLIGIALIVDNLFALLCNRCSRRRWQGGPQGCKRGWQGSSERSGGRGSRAFEGSRRTPEKALITSRTKLLGKRNTALINAKNEMLCPEWTAPPPWQWRRQGAPPIMSQAPLRPPILLPGI